MSTGGKGRKKTPTYTTAVMHIILDLKVLSRSPAHYHRWHCRAFVPAGVSQLRIAYTPVNLTFPAELMAAQLATTLSGFTGNLFADQEEMVEDADSDRLASWEKNYLAPSEEFIDSCHVGIMCMHAKLMTWPKL